MFAKYIASQFRKPEGFIGRFFISRFLSRENKSINALAFSMLDLNDSDRVLEAGFGGGDLLGLMGRANSKAELYGIDFSPEMLDLCQKKLTYLISQGRLLLNCADIKKMPYKSEYFTKICTVNTIYFWEDSNAVISELKRVLQKKGILVIAAYNADAMDSYIMKGFRLFNAEDVSRMMQSAVFSNICIRKENDYFAVSGCYA